MALQPEPQLPGSQQLSTPIRKGRLKRWSQLLWRSKTGTVGFFIVVAVILVAAFASVLAPHDPNEINPINMLQPPMWIEGGSISHILGTDNLGRDILSRIIYGSQISLLVGIASVVVAGIIGVTIGI